MADIFISYARADRDTAKLFADAFVEQGWSVWWDPEIFYGTQYDKAIEDELRRAKCVVVLWSTRSVRSRWVRSEASTGVNRNALVPVRIDAEAEVPLEFTKIQTAELASWDGDRDNPTFKGLARGIERVIRSAGPAGQEATPPALPEQRPSALTFNRRTLVRLGVLAAPTLAVLVLAGIAMLIHRPTAFDLDLTVTNVSFVCAGEQAALLVGKTAFTALAVHGIEEGTIGARRAELVQEAGSVTARSLPLPLPVAISQRLATGAHVRFAAPGGGASAVGDLDRVFLPPGRRAELAVTQEHPPQLSVRVLDQSLRIVLSIRGESNVELVGARIDSGSNAPIEAATLTLRLEAADSGSLVELVGTAAGLTVLLAPAAGPRPSIALVSDLRVSEIQFQTQGPTGATVTTVSGDGTIGFPKAPDKAKIAVTAGHYVALRGLRDFFLRKVVFEPERSAVHLEAGGLAGSLRSGPVGGVEERALTWFDSIWHQPRSVQLFGLALWFFPTTLAAYKLLKELRQ